ncbi:hypothetical protein Ciccas_011052, partial [Cichlidogyrus casuarinus]
MSKSCCITLYDMPESGNKASANFITWYLGQVGFSKIPYFKFNRIGTYTKGCPRPIKIRLPSSHEARTAFEAQDRIQPLTKHKFRITLSSSSDDSVPCAAPEPPMTSITVPKLPTVNKTPVASQPKAKKVHKTKSSVSFKARNDSCKLKTSSNLSRAASDPALMLPTLASSLLPPDGFSAPPPSFGSSPCLTGST